MGRWVKIRIGSGVIVITTLVYETVMPAALAMYGAMDELAMDEMSSGGD